VLNKALAFVLSLTQSPGEYDVYSTKTMQLESLLH